MAEQPELRLFLENPIVTEDAKIKLVGSIFESSIDKVALHFIYVMINAGAIVILHRPLQRLFKNHERLVVFWKLL